MVFGPKVVVSFPIEPAPVRETGKPFVFKKIWSCLTSGLTIPNLRVLVKVKEVSAWASCIGNVKNEIEKTVKHKATRKTNPKIVLGILFIDFL